MIKVDLITGFLGSGKTTFIKQYARYLINQGMKIGIIENDYGAVNVDMMLLGDELGQQCDLEMIAGGCDLDCHRRRFKTKLIAMGMLGYDRILIEPSGIYDVDEFFDVLYESPLDNWYEIGNVIAIVDAKLDNHLSKESDYILASEVANAGCVLLSRSQNASNEDIRATIQHINKALIDVKCQRQIKNEIIIKPWYDFNDDDYQNILECGYVPEDYLKLGFQDENVFQSLYFMQVQMSIDELKAVADHILNDTSCGQVMRIKGFVQIAEQWYELNATHNEITIQEISIGQEIVIVIGEHLNEENIQAYFKHKAVH
ncbi:MAG: GTP-binding protein [Erysipelotrichaceae bacterium]|nr:GTP-binding protein [Erysipelotrichaceae bacterium]